MRDERKPRLGENDNTPLTKRKKYFYQLRQFQNVQFCSRSRKAKILTTGIHVVFRGLKFEPDTDIGQKGTF